jgi:hypothetical protein
MEFEREPAGFHSIIRAVICDNCCQGPLQFCLVALSNFVPCTGKQDKLLIPLSYK